MRINKKLEFVYISTPKCCTHTIYKILEDHYSDGLRKAGFHNNRIVDGYQKYFRWTVVRNPFSRAVSIWWSACRLAHKDQYKFRARSGGQYDFTTFVEWMANVSDEEKAREPLLQNQTEWLTPAEPIHAIHLENLMDELRELPFWKDGIQISKLNTTDEKIKTQSELEGNQISKPLLSDLYNERSIEAVLKWADPDFDRFEYKRIHE